MTNSVSEIVVFLHSYPKMHDDQKTSPETVQRLEKIKELIEELLPQCVFVALEYADTLANLTDNKEWFESMAKRAIPIYRGLGEEDQFDLQPIISPYL